MNAASRPWKALSLERSQRTVAGGWARRISNPHEQANLMKITDSSTRTYGSIAAAFVAAAAATAISTLVHAADSSSLPAPRAEGWLMKSYSQISDTALRRRTLQAEMAALKAIVAKRSADDIARFHWWATGGPVYRWNEIILDEMQEGFVTVPTRRSVISRCSRPRWTMRLLPRGTTANPARVLEPVADRCRDQARTARDGVISLGTRRCGTPLQPRCSAISSRRARSHFAAKAEEAMQSAPARRCRASA